MAYVSRPQPELAVTEIPRIVSVARANNVRDGLTGVLVYTGADFAQLIEGPESAVATLWARVAADKRHRDISILLDETNHRPWFPDWRMGYLVNADLARQIALWRDLRRRIGDGDRVELRRVLAAADTL
ncbi:MAG: BLUF domain-containing protein [Casimicrobiaceae bacterium]